MPKPFVIIDGYNLMHAAGFARERYGPGGLERAREQFLRTLISMITPEMQPRTTVVFDAFDSPGNEHRRSRRDGVTVLFAGAGGDADSLIETLIAEHSAPRQVRVVSDDRRLKRAARKRKARPWNSLDYWERLTDHAERVSQSPRESQVAPEKFEGQPAPAEVRHWLKVFGSIFTKSRTPDVQKTSAAPPTKPKRQPPPTPKSPVEPKAGQQPTKPLPTATPPPPIEDENPAPTEEVDLTDDELAFWEKRVRELDERNPE